MFEDIYRFQKKYAAEHKVPVMLDESMAILQETVRRARPKRFWKSARPSATAA